MRTRLTRVPFHPVTLSPWHLVILLLLSASGCSSDTKMGTVNGEVLLDGKPLQEGLIRFLPMDGKSQTVDTAIRAGRFQATVPIGERRVEISAPKVVGKQKMYDMPNAPFVDEVAELIPERYNVRSELAMTVEAGSQEKQFTLKSK
jgi:hypothetical protein